MPNYEYECDGEGLSIVLDLPMEHEIPRCQVCGANLKRVYTAVPAIFKGSGWAGKKWNLGATSALPILSLSGLMGIPQLMDLGYSNALSVVLLEQRT